METKSLHGGPSPIGRGGRDGHASASTLREVEQNIAPIKKVVERNTNPETPICP
ncbi:hypothetical protein Csa_006638 [Cucumis sativus]|uniref:Uncharacterized protein n=1 Tax=Cucumis sativus TaxID=3659 RepID=A0A0A0LL88_CUCSA|nr:hypothetical protein Csa_006638 [Cucumis sativus]